MLYIKNIDVMLRFVIQKQLNVRERREDVALKRINL